MNKEEIYSRTGAFLLEPCLNKDDTLHSEAHLKELCGLVETMGVNIIDSEIVNIRKVSASFFLGKGLVEQLCQMFEYNPEVEFLVIDAELTPSQQRNLENSLNVPVIDRQEVILEIFADRAHTKEAVLQVALARMRYSLPRLKRAWTHLSRQRGGARGNRGKGETQLESDRRMVEKKIRKLEKALEKVKEERRILRKNRENTAAPRISIMGYTNAGKSSLLNLLAGSEIYAKNQLFATLDPTSRIMTLPGGRKAILTDTVGFVRKLPHDLIEAFKATLEETSSADLLLHVIDISSPEWKEHKAVTEQVLLELNASEIPVISVFNKADRVDDIRTVTGAGVSDTDSVVISVKKNTGIDELTDLIGEYLNQSMKEYNLYIPYKRGDILSYLYEHYTFSSKEEKEEGTVIVTHLSEKDRIKLSSFLTG